MVEEVETCIRCGTEDIHNELPGGLGVIYIRAQKDGNWGTHAICVLCWNKEHPEKQVQ